RVRVAILLFVLFVVVLYAIRDYRSRRARKEWDHTLAVAIVVLRADDVDVRTVDALRMRAPALADRLTGEMRRHRSAPMPPFRFRVLGPVDGAPPAPAPRGDGPVDLAKESL